jgi:glutamate transport system permease protein
VTTVLDNLDLVVRGFTYTVLLFLVAGVLSLLLGTVLAAMRVGPVAVLRRAVATYVTIVRNTPLLIVLLFFRLAGPKIGLNFNFVDIVIGDVRFNNLFAACVAALTAYTSTFVCEALRSGINAVPLGQAEAARAIGLTFGQSLREIVLPQAFRTVVPPLGNVWIAMVKNTSIAAGFSVTELSSTLPRLVNADAGDLTLILIGVVAGYMLITLPSAFAIHRLERRVAILR